jgi:outer membrane biosynthesis protein TonB
MDEDDTVSSELSAEERSLQDQVELSEKVLDDLERDLLEVDSELEALAKKGHQYEALSQVCHSLEQLDKLGGKYLFWDELGGRDDQAEHLRYARRKTDEFAEEIAQFEDRRSSINDKIGGQNGVLDYLHYDLLDAMEREESIKNEWLVDREADKLPFRSQVMPWARGLDEDHRFRKALAASVLVCLMASLLVSIVDLPIPDRATLTEVPERVAKLVREEKTPPPPPAPVQEPVAPDEELPEPEPELAEEQPPDEIPESIEQPIVAEVEEPDTREQVKSKGILAFRDSFASRANIRPTAQLGSQARVSNAGMNAVGRPERSMVSTSAPGSSGGINLAALSRDVGGGGQAIEGVQVTRVASAIGGDGGPDRPLSGGALSGRTDEEIQIIFDRYKAALYRLYNRELRKDPTLRGQLILRLTIEPDGSVSLCQLQSSDMEAPVLARQVVDRVRNFDFGAKDGIVAMTIIYPIDFLPAA